MGRSFAPFNEAPDKYWSVRLYKQLLPEVADLPESHRRAWLYIGLFPNLVLMLYPDRVGFYQEYPLAVGRTEQRFRWTVATGYGRAAPDSSAVTELEIPEEVCRKVPM